MMTINNGNSISSNTSNKVIPKSSSSSSSSLTVAEVESIFKNSKVFITINTNTFIINNNTITTRQKKTYIMY